MPAWY